MSGPDEKTVERVAKAMWGVDNPEVEMHWAAAVRFERMAEAAMPDAKGKARVTVPDGQTPLNDNLGHPLLDVISEGRKAFDDGTSSPYHGHSLEHCLHAMGWVQRDLRVALDNTLPDTKALEAADRLADAYASLCNMTGKNYHEHEGSCYATYRAARGGKA